jgi:hypothetical protein
MGFTAGEFDEALRQISQSGEPVAFEKIDTLILESDRLTELPESFGAFTHLHELDILNTAITRLPDCVAHYPALRIYHHFADDLLNTDMPLDDANYGAVCRGVLEHLFLCADKACGEGLLALEYGPGISYPDDKRRYQQAVADRLRHHDLIEWGMRLIMRGCDPDTLDCILGNIAGFEPDTRKRALKMLIHDALVKYAEAMFSKSGFHKPGNLMVWLVEQMRVADDPMRAVCDEYARTNDDGVFRRCFNTHFNAGGYSQRTLTQPPPQGEELKDDITTYRKLCRVMCCRNPGLWAKKTEMFFRNNRVSPIICDITARFNYRRLRAMDYATALIAVSSCINFADEKVFAVLVNYLAGIGPCELADGMREMN